MSDRKPVILIVDDDPDLLDQLSLMLTQEGYIARGAESAADAEELILSIRPDLAILDVMMEERDSGFVLCHQIKKLHPETPVIILTSVKAATGISFAAVTAEEQSWIQADLVLDKPVQPEKLKAEIRRLLRREPAEPKKAH